MHTRSRTAHRPILASLLLPAALVAQAGAPDVTFGGGIVAPAIAPPNEWDFARCLAVQPDGKVVVAGNTRPTINTSGEWAIARYRNDGALDPAFGQGGVVRLFGQSGLAEILGLEVDGNARIVAAGWGQSAWNIVRLLANGQLDASFGSAGVVQTPFGANTPAHVRGMVLQPDGKVVTVGEKQASGGGNASVVLVRHQTNGALDTSYGKRGIATVSVSGGAYLGLRDRVIARQSDGKILLGGLVGTSLPNQWTVFRVTANGVLDSSFGAGGIATWQLPANQWRRVESIAVQPDGRILTTGPMNFGTYTDLVVVRALADGALDASFGTNGVAICGLAGSGPWANAAGHDCVVQPDGNIVVAAEVQDPSSGMYSMTACRLLPNGLFDAGFAPAASPCRRRLPDCRPSATPQRSIR